jgi:hypothetical protein
MFLQKWDVFLVELFLQGFGGGGNDHAAAAANRGNQVSQRFPGSGTGFHYSMVMFYERIVHRFGHFQLPGTMLVAANHAAFEQTAGSKNIAHGGTGWRGLASRRRRFVANMDLFRRFQRTARWQRGFSALIS